MITNFVRISEEEVANQAFLEKRQILINTFLDMIKRKHFVYTFVWTVLLIAANGWTFLTNDKES